MTEKSQQVETTTQGMKVFRDQPIVNLISFWVVEWLVVSRSALWENTPIVINYVMDHYAAWRYHGALDFTDVLGEKKKLETRADFFDIGCKGI